MDISQNLKTVLDNISSDINVINDKVETKQAEITSENKLDYSLISGAPAGGEAVWGGISGTLSNQTDLQNALNAKANTSDIPLSTSQLTNDSGFVTSSVMEDALSGKQDLITESEWLPATYVRMDIDHWQGDPDFDVAAAVNMTRDDVYAVSGVVSGLLSSKQDAITNDNKLDYGLLSGTPSIPLSTSELINDSDFQTSTDVVNAISGKAEQTDVDAISGELDESNAVLTAYIDDYELLNTPFYVETREANNAVAMHFWNTAYNPTLKWSYDNKNWKNYYANDVISLSGVGDRVYFKGNNDRFSNQVDITNLSASLSINIGGNIMSLVDETMKKNSVGEGEFNYFAYDVKTLLVDASNLLLPAMKLSNKSYAQMFQGCTTLTAAPKVLPATDVAMQCYYQMFDGCTALTKAPTIMMESLLAYAPMRQMFNGCTSLNEMEVHFTEWNSGGSANFNWVQNVPESGTFKCPAALDTSSANKSKNPIGWTVVNI